MSITAKRFALAGEQGAAARRGGRSVDVNPWRHASTSDERALRDAWADAWHAEDQRRRRA